MPTLRKSDWHPSAKSVFHTNRFYSPKLMSRPESERELHLELCICAFTYHVLQLLQEASLADRTEQELAKCVVL